MKKVIPARKVTVLPFAVARQANKLFNVKPTINSKLFEEGLLEAAMRPRGGRLAVMPLKPDAATGTKWCGRKFTREKSFFEQKISLETKNPTLRPTFNETNGKQKKNCCVQTRKFFNLIKEHQ